MGRRAEYALFGKALTGTLSVFRITKSNVLVTDTANLGFSIATGRARSRGVEFDANLALDRRLTATLVYAYTDAKVIRDTRPLLVGSSLLDVPKHSGALLVNWLSDARREGSIGIGGGVIRVGSRAGDAHHPRAGRLRAMRRLAGVLLTAAGMTGPVEAQRTQENTVREAEDGFGRSVGSKSIGIYAAGEVRGFYQNQA